MSASQTEARDAAIELKTFTVAALSFHLSCTNTEAKDHLAWMIKRKIVIDVGPLRQGKRGRPPHVYVYFDPHLFGVPVQPAERKKEKPPERLIVNQMPKSRQAPTGRRKGRKVSREVEEILKEVESLQGWFVDRKPAHPRIIAPDGSIIIAPATPSDHRGIANTRALIERKKKEVIL